LSEEQIKYFANLSKDMGEFTDFRKSIILSKSEDFVFNHFKSSLLKNHSKILRLADMNGMQSFVFETFGIGFLLSILLYSTYLVQIGAL